MLKEIFAGVAERQRQFLLMRMIGVNKSSALATLSIPDGTYKRWVCQEKFQGIYQRIDELGLQNREEALLMLRDANYALVVKLEEDMLRRLIQEIVEKKPVFAKTNLGREIYSRLATEISTKPQVQNVTWEQLILQGAPTQERLPEGKNDNFIEAEVSEAKESPESQSD